MTEDPRRAAVLAALPPATRDRLNVYAGLLKRWQSTINLVAPATLPDLWSRHIDDSLQVQAAAPDARRWLDLGSGGGFPGLVTAIVLAGEPDAEVHLVESDKRKAAFLRTVIRETDAPAVVHVERIERFVATPREVVHAVSARALAPLPQLLAWAESFILAGATGVFPKGRTADAELTAANLDNRFAIESIPSRIDRAGRILIVRASRRPSS